MSENISETEEKDIATITNEIACGMQKGRDSRTAMNHGPWRPDGGQIMAKDHVQGGYQNGPKWL